MKNKFIKIAALGIIFAIVFAFSGCTKTDNNSLNVETEPITTEPVTEAPTGEEILRALHSFDTDSEDPFSGIWTITAGQGNQYENFYYLFNGKDTAILFTGNTGYMGKYELGKDEDGNDTFTTKLMFGINGTYTYKFNKEKNEAVLFEEDTDVSTTITKTNSFDFIPVPEKNPVIDENILGAWKSNSGEYFYFDESGIMYQNLFDTMFTYATYTIKNGQIVTSYTTGGNRTGDKYNYSLSAGTLSLGEFTYERIPVTDIH